jgi:uncharacterized Zn finger protein
MSYFGFRPYVPVAVRQQRAQKALAKLMKGGEKPAPVKIAGRTIASSFWGKSWCENLEHYSDYASRLPRGRSYVRNGSVLDLRIDKGKIAAKVAGSELYNVAIEVAPVKAPHWKAVCRDCAGSIDSVVELLQGRLAKGVMERVCRKGDGLFPTPQEIKLSCSCPDWADMCKHVAAVLYGVGTRLDEEPALLFVLRNVDEKELLAGAGGDLSFTKATPRAKVLDDGDVAALFGLEMAEPSAPEKPKAIARARPKPPPDAGAPTVKPVADKKTANKAIASKKAASEKAPNKKVANGKIASRSVGKSGGPGGAAGAVRDVRLARRAV